MITLCRDLVCPACQQLQDHTVFDDKDQEYYCWCHGCRALWPLRAGLDDSEPGERVQRH